MCSDIWFSFIHSFRIGIQLLLTCKFFFARYYRKFEYWSNFCRILEREKKRPSQTKFDLFFHTFFKSPLILSWFGRKVFYFFQFYLSVKSLNFFFHFYPRALGLFLIVFCVYYYIIYTHHNQISKGFHNGIHREKKSDKNTFHLVDEKWKHPIPLICCVLSIFVDLCFIRLRLMTLNFAKSIEWNWMDYSYAQRKALRFCSLIFLWPLMIGRHVI